VGVVEDAHLVRRLCGSGRMAKKIGGQPLGERRLEPFEKTDTGKKGEGRFLKRPTVRAFHWAQLGDLRHVHDSYSFAFAMRVSKLRRTRASAFSSRIRREAWW
jgi:hypothetical protein